MDNLKAVRLITSHDGSVTESSDVMDVPHIIVTKELFNELFEIIKDDNFDTQVMDDMERKQGAMSYDKPSVFWKLLYEDITINQVDCEIHTETFEEPLHAVSMNQVKKMFRSVSAENDKMYL